MALQRTEDADQFVLEIFSNSLNAWFIGLAAKYQDNLLLVRFLDNNGGVRQKVSASDDRMFAPFGTNIASSIPPPGFIQVPSNTRPGHFSCFDPIAKRKLATVSLAWRAYLQSRFAEAGIDGTPANLQLQSTRSNGYSVSFASTREFAPNVGDAPHLRPAVDSQCDIHMRANGLMKAAHQSQALSIETALAGVQDWVAQYTHLPVESSHGVVYFKIIPIDLIACAEMMRPMSEVNQGLRDQLILEIESGAVMATALHEFRLSRFDDELCLHWADGGIRNFISCVFHDHEVAAPGEQLIRPIFEAFDDKMQEKLSVHRCICLVDAIMRAVFIKRVDAARTVEVVQVIDKGFVQEERIQEKSGSLSKVQSVVEDVSCVEPSHIDNVAMDEALTFRKLDSRIASEDSHAIHIAPKLTVEDFVATYTHLPVETTLGLVYFNTTPVNFTLYVEMMMPISFINDDRREKILLEIENGSVMHTSLDMFCRSNTDNDNNLHWEDGGVRDFVIWVFHQHGLDAPTEDLIRPLFQAFDLEKIERLGAWEGICLVDAVMRAAFLRKFEMPDAPDDEYPEEQDLLQDVSSLHQQGNQEEYLDQHITPVLEQGNQEQDVDKDILAQREQGNQDAWQHLSQFEISQIFKEAGYKQGRQVDVQHLPHLDHCPILPEASD